MLELDGAMRPANLHHKSRAMPGFYIGLSCEIGCQHGEIIGDDDIELIALPIVPIFASSAIYPAALPRKRFTVLSAPAVSFSSHSQIISDFQPSALSAAIFLASRA